MTLKQLEEQIFSIRKRHGNSADDMEIVISVHGLTGLGYSPAVDVTSVSEGIDWDMNRIFFNSQVPLTLHNKTA